MRALYWVRDKKGTDSYTETKNKPPIGIDTYGYIRTTFSNLNRLMPLFWRIFEWCNRSKCRVLSTPEIWAPNCNPKIQGTGGERTQLQNELDGVGDNISSVVTDFMNQHGMTLEYSPSYSGRSNGSCEGLGDVSKFCFGLSRTSFCLKRNISCHEDSFDQSSIFIVGSKLVDRCKTRRNLFNILKLSFRHCIGDGYPLWVN